MTTDQKKTALEDLEANDEFFVMVPDGTGGYKYVWVTENANAWLPAFREFAALEED